MPRPLAIGANSFAVMHGPNGFEVDFAGIIVQGGRTVFRIIKGGVVTDFLRTISDWGARREPPEPH